MPPWRARSTSGPIRADPMSLSLRVGIGLGQGFGGGGSASAPAFNPISLFGGGEQGVIYDLIDPTTVFQERTGASATTPSGNNGPVGTLKDNSPNNNYAIAPSDGVRPVYKFTTIPNIYMLPDAVDDGLTIGPISGIVYIAAAVTVPPTGGPVLALLCNSDPAVDGGDVRLNNATTWRCPATVTTVATDFPDGGSSTINGVNGGTFVNNTPHVFEMVSPTGKNLGNLYAKQGPNNPGNMLVFRFLALSRLPTVGERTNIRKWLGAGAGMDTSGFP